MRRIKKRDTKSSDAWYGGRIPVGNVDFAEPTYQEDSSIYVSRYSKGITVLMAIGTLYPIEITFGIRQTRDLMSLLRRALDTKPRFREQWRDVGSVEYAICDWDDPTLDDNTGSLSIRSGKKDIRIIIRTDPRNSGIDLRTNEVQFESRGDVISDFVDLLEDAVSSSTKGSVGLDEQLEDSGGPDQTRHVVEERRAIASGTTEDEINTGGELKFHEINYGGESRFLIGRDSDGARFFIEVGNGDHVGPDCELWFDNKKTDVLTMVLKEAVGIAKSDTEDWKRIGFAPYTLCGRDYYPLDGPRGHVIIDARKGRIRLIVRADSRSDMSDWPLVTHVDVIEELIATLERTSQVTE